MQRGGSGSENGMFLSKIDGYKIENCSVYNIDNSGIAVYGSVSYKITNGIIRNCTVYNVTQNDGITLHQDDSSNSIGPNHLVINCTGYECGEQAFDVSGPGTTEKNIIIKDCEGYGNTKGTLSAGGIENLTVDGLYSHDEIKEGLIIINKDQNVIIRNCIVYNNTDDNLLVYGNSGNVTSNITVYNNNFIRTATGGSDNCIQTDGYINYLTFKNNIFTSTGDTNPALMLRMLVGTLANKNETWTNNMWWRGDGLTGDHWYVAGNETIHNFAEWSALTRVVGDLRDDPELTDATNGDFTLNDTSPCIDTGDWLTQTDGTGSTTYWVTVDNANYFFADLNNLGPNDEDVVGDNIFVGTDTNLKIIEINYANESFKVNRSISWADDENVSLSAYNDSKPDIGARETATDITSYNTTIRNNGLDYFIWMGNNVTANYVKENMTSLDETSEYIAILADTGLWSNYYGDDSGTNWDIHTFDVVKSYFTDSDTQNIEMTVNPDIDYSASRTVTLCDVGNGYNYTGYTNSTSTNLSNLVTKLEIPQYYTVALWNETTFVWNWHIADWPYNVDRNVHQYNVIMTKIAENTIWNI